MTSHTNLYLITTLTTIHRVSHFGHACSLAIVHNIIIA